MKLDQITATFQCFMDATRFRLVKLLVNSAEKDIKEICVSDFVSSLDEPQYNISKQLKILELANVLSSRKEGRNVYFRLASGKLAEGIFELVADLPGSEPVFTSDFKKLEKAMKARGVVKKALPKKRKKSPVVQPPRELESENDLPSNLL